VVYHLYVNEELETLGSIASDRAIESLREEGYRVLEQRFPRRAWVVIRGETQKGREERP
jgi:hypothetical protein